MMAHMQNEIHSFACKFAQLIEYGYNANLNLSSNDGNIVANLKVDIGRFHPPSLSNGRCQYSPIFKKRRRKRGRKYTSNTSTPVQTKQCNGMVNEDSTNDFKEVLILPESWFFASSKSCDLEFRDGVSEILNLSSEDTNQNHCSQNAPSNTYCLDETADASPEPDVAEVSNLSSDTPPKDSPTRYLQESQKEL